MQKSGAAKHVSEAGFADVFCNSCTVEVVSIQWANFMTSHKTWGEVDLMSRCTTCICANTMTEEISRPTYDWLLQTQAMNPCKWTSYYCYHRKKCHLLSVHDHHGEQNISQKTVPFSANKLSKDYSPLIYNPFEYTSVLVYVHNNSDIERQFIMSKPWRIWSWCVCKNH
jgi:hypothetical protein